MFTEPIVEVADQRLTRIESFDVQIAGSAHQILTCEIGNARRAEAEAFIRRRYQRSHGARVATFMPTLLLLVDAAGELAAAVGFRSAEKEALFLESYLTAPIQQILSSKMRSPVRREQILEVGNFAAVDARRARILMSFLPAFFLDRSAQWIVFTATSTIRGILNALGGRCVELGLAEGARVSGGTDEWGRYYSDDPRVMAGFLQSTKHIPALWRTAHGD